MHGVAEGFVVQLMRGEIKLMFSSCCPPQDIPMLMQYGVCRSASFNLTVLLVQFYYCILDFF